MWNVVAVALKVCINIRSTVLFVSISVCIDMQYSISLKYYGIDSV